MRLANIVRGLAIVSALIIGRTGAVAATAPYPVVRPNMAFHFPADHGAHPDYRTEWWYVTGWLRTGDGRDLGFQVTFFRVRPAVDPDNPSRFAPRQILFAHAGLSDPSVGHLLHGERSARAGFGLAEARIGDADVHIRDWRLRRLPNGDFTSEVVAPDFRYSLTFHGTQPVMLQGDAGYSRKGPDPAQASHYYSLPHLTVSGTVTRHGKTEPVTGTAWLDREWSSSYLGGNAVGWDWTGLNLDDGGALMAFRIRGKDGRTTWAGGSLRRRDGRIVVLARGDVTFTPLRTWRSPRTGGVYPVAQRLKVRLPEGPRTFLLTPLFPDQELDGRRAGLPAYWEGAVRTQGGRGYLELTGYAAALRM
ncbi:Predicted secreted hydrolase [Sphingomonas sp. YR710]|uniref:lipocalin-like domain-containing protein n=1 Tax=Sphingomonas sp. YR710 TaxID=1882773 RepID=UPI00088F56D9|nr:carotenoid 1,2-hydratase [Sphingomonas sp. YR710]SDD62207.1 Predicted secreted hydrolase [Sphingomonas sp. YR710]